jgi:hypothetical protein
MRKLNLSLMQSEARHGEAKPLESLGWGIAPSKEEARIAAVEGNIYFHHTFGIRSGLSSGLFRSRCSLKSRVVTVDHFRQPITG